MNWTLNIICIGIFNGLMLSILFLRKKDHNLYFGLFLIAHSIILVKYLGNALEMFASFHILIASGEILEWLIGPFLFFYCMKYSNQKIHNPFIHFIPVTIFVLVLVPLHIYMIKHPNSELFQLQIQRSEVNYQQISKLILGFFYVIYTITKVTPFRWLKMILGIYGTEVLVLTLFYFQYLHHIDWISDVTVSLVMTFSINVIAISGLMRSSMFSVDNILEEKPKNSPAEQDGLQEVFLQVKNFLEQNEAYKNQSLRLADLAEELSISEKTISSAINACAGTNINAFINTYRIGLAEKLLLNPKYNHYTIDAIAEDCGFSNKVSFYQAFKKIHQLSPKEFKDRKTA